MRRSEILGEAVLNDDQFEQARRVALRLAGIELHDRHRELLAHRSRRLGIRDARDLSALFAVAEGGDVQACRRVISLVTTHFTGFFRHPRHFELAARHAGAAARRRGWARLWSAGAATGEEPYSMAMALTEVFGREDPPATILATDVDVDALAVGERGHYRESRLEGLDATRRRRFLVEAPDDHAWLVGPALRDLVEFRPLNLAEETWEVPSPIDVILCRNVLMYLDQGRRVSVLGRMASLLAPDGVLMVDPSEHLGNASQYFVPAGEGLYRLHGGPSPSKPVTKTPGRSGCREPLAGRRIFGSLSGGREAVESSVRE